MREISRGLDKKLGDNNNQVSTEASDGGTMRRVGQSILTWLSDKEAPVFVIATANDITSLPPELTRAGRFDEIFFVSVPSQEEREEILSIHLRKRGYVVDKEGIVNDHLNNITTSTVQEVAAQMDGFTGAEIEQVVAESGRRAYASYRKGQREESLKHYITKEELLKQVAETIPMSERNPDVLHSLREWAKHSAKCASSHEREILYGGGSKSEREKDILNTLELDLD